MGWSCCATLAPYNPGSALAIAHMTGLLLAPYWESRAHTTDLQCTSTTLKFETHYAFMLTFLLVPTCMPAGQFSWLSCMDLCDEDLGLSSAKMHNSLP